MNTERDKFLTEAMGECWHETMLVADEEGGGAPFHICRKCKIGMYSKANNNFSTWEGFGKLWEWAQKQDWWEDLCQTFYGWSTGHYDLLLLIKPDRFADAVYKFLREKDND